MTERRSTDMFDIHGNEIFEGDYILQERSDKPWSKTKKTKKIKGKVVWVPADNERKTVGGSALNIAPHWHIDTSEDPDDGKFQCHSWSPFFRCEKVME